MSDPKYCYPDSDVLKNKLNIKDENLLFEAEIELTSIRLKELQTTPINGKFDFKHLKEIHRYIFQDLYEWAGKERTVEIGKGNLFCTVACIQDYATSVFSKYYAQCYSSRNNRDSFIKVFAENYGDLNALHPFREGNGRAQREFARLVCLKCGYDFDLSCATHREMLEASILSFERGDNSRLADIFSRAVAPHKELESEIDYLKILTMDDLTIGAPAGYEYYDNADYNKYKMYEEIYKTKISRMNAEETILVANSIYIDNEPYENQSEVTAQQERQNSISR